MSPAKRWRRLAVAALLAGALAVTACESDDGGDGSRSGDGRAAGSAAPDRELAAVYDRFATAIAEHRWSDACALYSTRYAAVYPKSIGIADGCVDTMKVEFLALTRRAQLPRVYKVERRGPRSGTVVVRARPNWNGTAIDVVLEDGGWRLDGPNERATRPNPNHPFRPD